MYEERKDRRGRDNEEETEGGQLGIRNSGRVFSETVFSERTTRSNPIRRGTYKRIVEHEEEVM